MSVMLSVLLNADASSFTRAGYPTIATVGGFFIFFYTLYYAATKTGYGGWRNHAVWFFFNCLLWLFGLFLVFGPDQLIGVYGLPNTFTTNAAGNTIYGTGSSQFGPRAAILGLQLMVQAALGVFAIYSANAYASLCFAMIGIFNELGLIGSLYFFNYNQPIWLLDPVECNQYFKGLPTDNISRCHDTGYLEFLRIIGTIEILVNGFLIVISLLAYATAVPAAFHPANTAAGTAAPYGAPAAGAGGYNAGPSYGTATAGPGFVAQGAGTAQPTYTTTTAPTATYTTTTTANPTYATTTGPTTTHL